MTNNAMVKITYNDLQKTTCKMLLECYYMVNIAKHDGCHMWSRNCLHFPSASLDFIGLLFCVVFCK